MAKKKIFLFDLVMMFKLNSMVFEPWGSRWMKRSFCVICKGNGILFYAQVEIKVMAIHVKEKRWKHTFSWNLSNKLKRATIIAKYECISMKS